MIFFGGANALQLWKLNQRGEVKNEKHYRYLNSLLKELLEHTERFYPIWETAEMEKLIMLIKRTRIDPKQKELNALIIQVQRRVFTCDRTFNLTIGDQTIRLKGIDLLLRAAFFSKKDPIQDIKFDDLFPWVAKDFIEYLQTGACQPTKRTVLPLLELYFQYECQPLFVILAEFLKSLHVESEFLNSDLCMDAANREKLVAEVKNKLGLEEEKFKLVLAGCELEISSKILLKRAPGLCQNHAPGLTVIKIGEFAPDVAEQFFSYLSTGSCLPNTETLLPLFRLANLYRCDDLIDVLCLHIKNLQTPFQLSHWIDLVESLTLDLNTSNNIKIRGLVNKLVIQFRSLNEEMLQQAMSIPDARLAIIRQSAQSIEHQAVCVAKDELIAKLVRRENNARNPSELFHFPYLTSDGEMEVFSWFKLWLLKPVKNEALNASEEDEINMTLKMKILICSRLLDLEEGVLQKLGLNQTGIEGALESLRNQRNNNLLTYITLYLLNLEAESPQTLIFKLECLIEKNALSPEDTAELWKMIGERIKLLCPDWSALIQFFPPELKALLTV